MTCLVAMDRSELLNAINEQYSVLLDAWHAHLFKHGMGAFVFLPRGYSQAKKFDETSWDYWTLADLANYLRKGGHQDEVLYQFFRTVDFRHEFAVVIVVSGELGKKEKFYFHKIANENNHLAPMSENNQQRAQARVSVER